MNNSDLYLWNYEMITTCNRKMFQKYFWNFPILLNLSLIGLSGEERVNIDTESFENGMKTLWVKFPEKKLCMPNLWRDP